MKTTHQFAKELLEGQDLPILIFDADTDPETEDLFCAPGLRAREFLNSDSKKELCVEIVSEKWTK